MSRSHVDRMENADSFDDDHLASVAPQLRADGSTGRNGAPRGHPMSSRGGRRDRRNKHDDIDDLDEDEKDWGQFKVPTSYPPSLRQGSMATGSDLGRVENGPIENRPKLTQGRKYVLLVIFSLSMFIDV